MRCTLYTTLLVGGFVWEQAYRFLASGHLFLRSSKNVTPFPPDSWSPRLSVGGNLFWKAQIR